MAKHQVHGYDPDDIKVQIVDGRLKVEGRHICHCTENCIDREFTRSFPLVPGIDADTITATLDRHGTIQILAEQGTDRQRGTQNVLIKVKGLDIPQSTKPSADELRKCLRQKGGIKLSKINRATGKEYTDDFKYDHEVLQPAHNMGGDINEEYDNDSFVEIVEY